MTPKQELQFEQMSEKIDVLVNKVAELSAEQKKVTTYLFVPVAADQKPRSDQLDRVFTTRRGYQFTSRIGMAVIGFFMMIGTMLITYDSVVAKIRGGDLP